MNKEKWLFIGTDKRLSICSELMIEKGYDSRSIQTNAYTNELEDVLDDYKPNHIVFPILEMDGAIPIEKLRRKTKLYTGVVSDEWKKRYLDASFPITSYLHDEIFIWENARLTAEAFLHVYYSEIGLTIAENRFFVAGYGRVGKMVADVLDSLGGQVTVIARSDAQLGEASMRGYQVLGLTNSLDVDGYLVNTIPNKWLSQQTKMPIFIFDLASAPGCLKASSTIEYYRLLPGLPGKYFPVEAAIALSGALERINRR